MYCFSPPFPSPCFFGHISPLPMYWIVLPLRCPSWWPIYPWTPMWKPWLAMPKNVLVAQRAFFLFPDIFRLNAHAQCQHPRTPMTNAVQCQCFSPRQQWPRAVCPNSLCLTAWLEREMYYNLPFNMISFPYIVLFSVLFSHWVFILFLLYFLCSFFTVLLYISLVFWSH